MPKVMLLSEAAKQLELDLDENKEVFDEAFDSGLIYRLMTTNLVYQPRELLERSYYIDVDMSKYIALLIDTLNHDASIAEYLNPTERIERILKKYHQE